MVTLNMVTFISYGVIYLSDGNIKFSFFKTCHYLKNVIKNRIEYLSYLIIVTNLKVLDLKVLS